MKNSSILATPANLATLRGLVSSSSARSAWSRGVRAYALDILEAIEEYSLFEYSENRQYLPLSEEIALNGARDWFHYATGGCGAALIWSDDIASRLCTPSELKVYRRGGVDVMECQGRALCQAWQLLKGFFCQL